MSVVRVGFLTAALLSLAPSFSQAGREQRVRDITEGACDQDKIARAQAMPTPFAREIWTQMACGNKQKVGDMISDARVAAQSDYPHVSDVSPLGECFYRSFPDGRRTSSSFKSRDGEFIVNQGGYLFEDRAYVRLQDAVLQACVEATTPSSSPARRPQARRVHRSP